jgi:hypothetical protein
MIGKTLFQGSMNLLAFHAEKKYATVLFGNEKNSAAMLYLPQTTC